MQLNIINSNGQSEMCIMQMFSLNVIYSSGFTQLHSTQTLVNKLYRYKLPFGVWAVVT